MLKYSHCSGNLCVKQQNEICQPFLCTKEMHLLSVAEIFKSGKQGILSALRTRDHPCSKTSWGRGRAVRLRRRYCQWPMYGVTRRSRALSTATGNHTEYQNIHDFQVPVTARHKDRFAALIQQSFPLHPRVKSLKNSKNTCQGPQIVPTSCA